MNIPNKKEKTSTMGGFFNDQLANNILKVFLDVLVVVLNTIESLLNEIVEDGKVNESTFHVVVEVVCTP